MKGTGQGVNVMSNYVSACPTSSVLADRLMRLRLVCALDPDKDALGSLWRSVAPDCCHTSSSLPLYPSCVKFLEVTFSVVLCSIMMIHSLMHIKLISTKMCFYYM